MSTTSTVTPPPEISPDALPMPPPQAIDAWDELKRHLSQLLRSTEPDAEWLKALDAAALRLRTLAHRSPDMALYLMLQSASVEVDRYSAQHAMLCALICELCAEALDWPADEVGTLVRAALTMNLSMSATQDALARQSGPLSELQREEVHTHAARSAALLAAAGVRDRLWLEVTRRHHDDIPPRATPGASRSCCTASTSTPPSSAAAPAANRPRRPSPRATPASMPTAIPMRSARRCCAPSAYTRPAASCCWPPARPAW